MTEIQGAQLAGRERQPAPAFVDIGRGHQLLLRDWGSGPAVLLLAGWAMDSRIWGETMLALNGAGLRTVSYDRRGHGGSTDPGVCDYEVLADDLARVIDSLDLSQLTLVAHSGAGGEALRYLSRHGSSRIARLILVGATGPLMLQAPDNPQGIPRQAHEQVLRSLQCDLDHWLAENTEPFAPGASARVQAWMQAMVMNASRRALVDFQRAIVEADLRKDAAAVDVPVTIISGDLDLSAPLALTAQRFAALMRDAELLVYENCAHGVMITHVRQLARDIARRVRQPLSV